MINRNDLAKCVCVIIMAASMILIESENCFGKSNINLNDNSRKNDYKTFYGGNDKIWKKHILPRQRRMLERTRHFYSAIESGNVDALDDIISQDISINMYSPEIVPFTGSYYGIEDALNFFGVIQSYVDIIDFNIKEMIPGLDKIVVLIREKGTVRTTGISFDSEMVQILTFRQKKVVQLDLFVDGMNYGNAFIEPNISDAYEIEEIGEGNQLYTFHGMKFDKKNRLYVGSLFGASIYRFNIISGDYEIFAGFPEGQADDMVFSPDGTLYWTSTFAGKIHAKKEDEPVKVIAEDLHGVNAIAMNSEGRLFASLGYVGDKLYEIDPSGKNEPIEVLDNVWSLNGFDFGPDGFLYGPITATGKIVKINIDDRTIEEVASGLLLPGAVAFDLYGNLFALESSTGNIFQIDILTNEKKIIAATNTGGMDNLAFNAENIMYVSNGFEGSIETVNIDTGEVDTFLSYPGNVALSDIDIYEDENGTQLHVGDFFTHKILDPNSGELLNRYFLFLDGLENSISVSVNDNHIIHSGWELDSVQKRDRLSGNVVNTIHGLIDPYDAIELKDGSILVAEYGTNRLLRIYDDLGEDVKVILDNLNGPVGLCKYSGDNLVALTENDSGVLSIVDVSSGKKIIIAFGLNLPEGVAVDRNGQILVAEVGKRRLLAIDPQTGKRNIIADGLEIGMKNLGAPNPYLQTGIAVSNTGVIYITSDIKNKVYKITPQKE